MGSRDLIAHNAGFDRSFLERVAGRSAFRGRWLDSLQVVRIALPRLRSHRLPDLAEAFGVTPEGPAHRALPDVEALAAVWRIALVGLSDLPKGLLHRLTELGKQTEWPVRSVLAHIAAAQPAAVFDLKETRRQRVAADKAEALHDADEVACVCPDAASVLAEFSAEGLAGRMYDGFESRAEQLEMGWWHNFPKYMISLMRAWYGDNVGPQNEWGFHLLPRITGDHSQLPMMFASRRYYPISCSTIWTESWSVGGFGSVVTRMIATST